MKSENEKQGVAVQQVSQYEWLMVVLCGVLYRSPKSSMSKLYNLRW